MDRVEHRDMDTIRNWLSSRGFESPMNETFSSIGYIVHGVAAAFLYTTNSSVAILGNCVSNPEQSPEVRTKAINELCNHLSNLAKEMGFKQVRVDTSIGNIEDCVVSQGFKKLGTFKSFIKEV